MSILCIYVYRQDTGGVLTIVLCVQEGYRWCFSVVCTGWTQVVCWALCCVYRLDIGGVLSIVLCVQTGHRWCVKHCVVCTDWTQVVCWALCCVYRQTQVVCWALCCVYRQDTDDVLIIVLCVQAGRRMQVVWGWCPWGSAFHAVRSRCRPVPRTPPPATPSTLFPWHAPTRHWLKTPKKQPSFSSSPWCHSLHQAPTPSWDLGAHPPRRKCSHPTPSYPQSSGRQTVRASAQPSPRAASAAQWQGGRCRRPR